jgi:hypothetical protein
VQRGGAGQARPVVHAVCTNTVEYSKGRSHSIKMVQTKAGSRNNPWLEHLRRCSAEYHRSKAAGHASSAAEHGALAAGAAAAAGATGALAGQEHIRRRAVGKKTEAKAATLRSKAKPKPKQMTEQDHEKFGKRAEGREEKAGQEQDSQGS